MVELIMLWLAVDVFITAYQKKWQSASRYRQQSIDKTVVVLDSIETDQSKQE